jgi:copper chaperone CopZ
MNMKTIKSIILVSIFTFAGLVGTAQENEKPKKAEEIKIQTSAICGMCKDRIEHDLSFEKGITSVSLDNETKIATVGYKPKKTNPDKIRKAISEIGYDADDVLANQEAHDKLPKCCQKGNKPH